MSVQALSFNEINQVSGGLSIVDSIGYGGGMGAFGGILMTNTMTGAAMGGAVGMAGGFAFGMGYAFGSWMYAVAMR